MRTWKDVATLVKTRGLTGRFVAQAAADLPFLLSEGMTVAFVPPRTDSPRRAVVDHVRVLDDGTCEVGFDTVPDEGAARFLVGCHCLVERACLNEADLQVGPSGWDGWEVCDVSAGRIGTVEDLLERPGQDLLVVSRGQAGPAYIPVVDELVISVDEQARLIVVDLPQGLLEL